MLARSRTSKASTRTPPSEIQTRAREYLEKQEAERDAKRKELGVADELAKVQGVTTAMLVAFGENGIKTLEDLADCATDDLIGWTERKKEKDAEPVRHKGVLEGFEIGRKEAEDMIMSARVAAGWINAGGPRQDARRAGGCGGGGRSGEGGSWRRRRPRPRRKRSWRGAEQRNGRRATVEDATTRRRTAVRCACAPSRASSSRPTI